MIIIDGNSGKKTVKILKFYEKDIDIWISENDNGMWDAWNKGFQLANGDYVGIVDSSNVLFPGAIKNLIKYIKKYPQLDFICGAVKKDNRLYAGLRVKDIKRQFKLANVDQICFSRKVNNYQKYIVNDYEAFKFASKFTLSAKSKNLSLSLLIAQTKPLSISPLFRSKVKPPLLITVSNACAKVFIISKFKGFVS